LGWEPQWLLVKRTNSTGSWFIFDTMRGLVTGGADQRLSPNANYAESAYDNYEVTATGFKDVGSNANAPFIYIAIRRGPMRQPESGTEVFAVDIGSNSPPYPEFGAPRRVGTRLLQGYALDTSSTAAQAAVSTYKFDYMDGWFSSDSANISHMFRRAPGFFDVVAFSGDGTNGRTVPHNLGVTPEMVIIKRRTNNGSGDFDAEHWAVWHPALNSNSIVYLSKNSGQVGYAADSYYPRYATLTGNSPESQIYLGVLSYGVGWTNSATETYVAYLFATLAGVSKVGSYTGNGSSQTINCGFTSGARFVLIKRTNSTGDWYVWDTARGIVAGNDPHLSLNTTAAQVTTNDSIDPDSSGFIVNQVSATNVNVSSSSYIFLAIA
jgi:hypothetical protein